jgi:hypothetical protein
MSLHKKLGAELLLLGASLFLGTSVPAHLITGQDNSQQPAPDNTKNQSARPRQNLAHRRRAKNESCRPRHCQKNSLSHFTKTNLFPLTGRRVPGQGKNNALESLDGCNVWGCWEIREKFRFKGAYPFATLCLVFC